MTTLLDNVFGNYLGMEFREDSVVVTYLKNSFSGIMLLSSASFPMRYDEIVNDEVREYIGRQAIDVSKVFVSLPDKWAITKFINVPDVTGKGKNALANLMKFEVERHIPFEIDDMDYDFLVTDRSDKTQSVVFTAVQKTRVNFVKEYLEKLAIHPDAITISSFAVLNSIELSDVSPGGWKDILGIVRRSDVLGKKGETNIAIYIDKLHASVAIIRNGLCTHMRSFSHDVTVPRDDFYAEISEYLSEIQSSLSLEHFNKLLLTGDAASTETLGAELNEKVRIDVITAKQVERYSGRLKGTDLNGLSASIGACFAGLGIGTYKINLLPHKTDYEIRRIAPMATKVFLVLILVLLVGIFTTEAVKQKRFLQEMEEVLKKNEPEVDALEKVLSDINSLRARSSVLAAFQKNEITLEVLAELAAIMPGDAWITNLNYKGINITDKKKKGGELIINGYAESSSVLIPLLEDSPYFEKVEFVGPIKKTREKEQFKLSAMIVRPEAGEEAAR